MGNAGKAKDAIASWSARWSTWCSALGWAALGATLTFVVGRGVLAAELGQALGSYAAPPTPPSPGDSKRAEEMIALVDRVSDQRFVARANHRFLLVSDLPAGDASEVLELLTRAAQDVERFARGLGLDPTSTETSSRHLSVAFSARGDFERFAAASDGVDARWMVGYWAPAADRTVFRRVRPSDGEALDPLDAATIAHESAHQLLHRMDVQRRGLHTPLFLAEGLATAFETSARAGSGPFAPQPDRQRRVSAALREVDRIPFAELVATPRLPAPRPGRSSDEEVERFYDMAWSLVVFLHQHEPAAFAAYLADLREHAATLSVAGNGDLFKRAFGSLERIERAWLDEAAR